MKDFLTTVLFVGFCIVMPPTIQAAFSQEPEHTVQELREKMIPLSIGSPCLPSMSLVVFGLNGSNEDEGVSFEMVPGDFDQFTDGKGAYSLDLQGWTSEGIIIVRDAKHSYTAVVRKITNWSNGNTMFCPTIVYRPIKRGETPVNLTVGQGT